MTGPEKCARFAGESGTSTTNPSTAQVRSPRHRAPSVCGPATGPATASNTAAIASGPSRRRIPCNALFAGADSHSSGTAPTRLSQTSSNDSDGNNAQANSKYTANRIESGPARRALSRVRPAIAASTSEGATNCVSTPRFTLSE